MKFAGFRKGRGMRKRRKAVLAVLFIVLVILLNQLLNYMLVQPGLGRTLFYECRNNDYECLILGASHGSYGLSPEQIGEELGCKVMNMCMGGEYMYDAYYILKYALKYKKLSTVILDIDYQYLVNQHDESILFNSVYNAYPDCAEKLGYFFDKMIWEDFRGTFLRWTNYWQCYYKIGKTVRIKQSEAYKNYSAEVVSMNPYDVYMGSGFVSRSRDCEKSTTSCLDWDESKLDEEQSGYIKKIVELCRDNNINIVFTTVVQDPDTVAEKAEGFQSADTYIRSLAEELGVTYLNFNMLKFEVFDRTAEDFYDREGHMYGDTAVSFSKVYGKAVKEALDRNFDEDVYFNKNMKSLYGDRLRIS
jgi:hypothetical protein